MEYQVIARRYRPQRFEEVVGQEPTAATLRNAIVQGRLAHAYLFCGPRGVGKTSMARIFARALNCERARDRSRPQEEWGRPCGACDVCRAIHEGEDIDVREMDGASNRGIEDVREIIDGVKFAPTSAPYKIYIVDEVHMLTREAFNAFLKVLEEPPSHVKFIFATTEVHKIPDTVLSRCQRFDFHPIGEAEIVRRLEQICHAEAVEPEPGLLETVARYSRGGLRDSQTLLDQMVSFSTGPLLIADLDRLTGRLTEDRLARLVAAVLDSDPATALEFLGEFAADGIDPAILLEQVVERLREQLLRAVREGKAEERIDRLVGTLEILLETAARLKGSAHPQLAVELALVKVARHEDPRSLEETIEWLRRLESSVGGAAGPCVSGGAGGAPERPAATRSAPPESRPPPELAQPESANGGGPADAGPAAPEIRADFARTAIAKAGPEPAVSPSAPAEPAEVERSEVRPDTPVVAAAPRERDPVAHLASVWDQIMIELRDRAPQAHAFLQGASMQSRVSGERERTVELEVAGEFHLKQLSEPGRRKAIEALIEEISGTAWALKLRVASGKDTHPSPAGGERRPRLREDRLVRKALDLFRGRTV